MESTFRRIFIFQGTGGDDADRLVRVQSSANLERVHTFCEKPSAKVALSDPQCTVAPTPQGLSGGGGLARWVPAFDGAAQREEDAAMADQQREREMARE